MLQGGFMSVLTSSSPDEFRDEVLRFAQQLGFDRVTAMTVIDRPGSSDFVTIDNTPPGYLDVFTDNTAGHRDPVMQHVKRQTVPIVWNQQTYIAQGAGELWEEQARFGYETGIAMALHLPEGKHFALGVVRDQALPVDVRELTRVVADLQLFAVHALEAALHLLVPAAPAQPLHPALTPRELEALRWTMEGKTAWEVGAILGISERTAVLHVNNAMHKLGCVNKHQAVVKALKLGLIH
jgi:DNA-binding CsgD family transcriptional regulator